MERQDIIKLAVDTYKGSLIGEFSKEDGAKALVQALIEANGGSTKLDYKQLRKNKVEIFEIIEEMVPQLVEEGLKGDEFFMQFVDERNLSRGDMNEFIIEANSFFLVSEIADGVSVPRRQRIGETTSKSVGTSLKGIRIYDELTRVLAGRIEWQTFVDKVVEAFKNKLYDDIYTTFSGINATTEGLNSTYVPTAGSYSEANLLTLVEHIESKTGKTALILGTKSALRKVSTAILSDKQKDEYYALGHFGQVAGVPMFSIKNRHKTGTDEFIFADNKLYIFAADDKFIKLVREGEGLMLDKDPMTNADLSQEYMYAERYGISVMIKDVFGIYEIS